MKALFIGLGGVGQRHLRNLLAQRPDVQLAAVRHRNRSFEIGDDLRPDYGVDIVEKYDLTCLPDLAAGLGWRPDLAVVANPSSLHAATALALIEAGIPTLVEKPVATNLAGAATLADAADRLGVPAVAGFVLRFHPLTRKLFEWVDDGRLGRLQSATVRCSHFLPHSHEWESMDQFYLGRRDLGGGAILSEIHSLDLVDRLFGRPQRLWCVGGRAADYPGDAEDTVSAVADYGTDGRAMTVALHLSLVERPPERSMDIRGDRGRILWHFQSGTARLEDQNGGIVESFTTTDYPGARMFVDEMRHFLYVAEGGDDPSCSLRSTLGAQALAEAMTASLASGLPQSLPSHRSASQ